MSKAIRVSVIFLGAAAWSGTALAGEVNGSTTNPKHYFSQGASICKFSGLNDNPSSTDPANPGGKTQSYGQDVRLGYLDPTNPNEPSPGTLCDPNSAPPELSSPN